MDKSATTKILIPSGALGLGYDRDALMRGIEHKPDLIAIDGGSTDSGPHYLGTGTSKYSRSSIKSEWRQLMQARAIANVPLVIGTAGTCGADDAVDWMLDITKEIVKETDQDVTVAILKSGQPVDRVISAFDDGRPSFVAWGTPYCFPITTLRPFGPRVVLTASANMSTPRFNCSRASESNLMIFLGITYSSFYLFITFI